MNIYSRNEIPKHLFEFFEPAEIGLEQTPDEYVAAMVEVFSLVWYLLADDGVLWLNLGDSYSGAGPSGASYESETTKRRAEMSSEGAFRISKTLAARGLTYAEKKPVPPPGLKKKDLIGIPWRVAFALQAAGWYLRQDIIWHKPNPMPESVTDRCTKAHEYIFLISKSERYYFDHVAIQEPATNAGKVVSLGGKSMSAGQAAGSGVKASGNGLSDTYTVVSSRNRRSVWTIATTPYAGAHFATFPPALIEPCILAGSRVGDVVLDPFMGSGTTAQVAQALGRQWIGCELNPEYAPLQQARTAQSAFVLR